MVPLFPSPRLLLRRPDPRLRRFARMSVQSWRVWRFGRGFQPEQSFDCHVHVHFLAFPQRNRRVRCEIEAGLAVFMQERENVFAEIVCPDGWDGIADRIGEFRNSLIGHPDAVAAFVQQSVVMATEKREVSHFYLAAIGPVLDVMCGYVLVRGTTGESAAVVAALRCAANGGRNAAALGIPVTVY